MIKPARRKAILRPVDYYSALEAEFTARTTLNIVEAS